MKEYKNLLIIISVVFSASCGGGGDAKRLEADPVILNPPAQIKITVKSTSAIFLSWQDTSDNEEGFIIERGLDGQAFQEIARVPQNTTEYSDQEIIQKTKYYYRISAYHGADQSRYSDTKNIQHFVYDACTETSPQAQVTSGIFYPFKISGLLYRSENHLSVTDQDSRYYYGDDTQTTFSIGYIPVAQIDSSDYTGIMQLASGITSGSNTNSKTTLNILRLLMSLDEDMDIQNGIQIPCTMSRVSGDIDFDLDEQAFNNQQTIISLLDGNAMPGQAETRPFYRSSLFTYYAGDYTLKYGGMLDGFIDLGGNISFTLNPGGIISNYVFSGYPVIEEREKSFRVDEQNNLLFDVITLTPVFLEVIYKIKLTAHIEPDHTITGTNRIYGYMNEYPGSVSGQRVE